MSLIKWPFKRKQYAGIGNPRFVSDIVAANEAVLDAIKTIAALGDSDFAIIAGLEYVVDVPNTYTPGVFYLSGNFYLVETSFPEGLYLAPAPTDILPQPFSDGNQRNTYTILYGASTSESIGSTPIFSGGMDQHRIGSSKLKSEIIELQSVANSLKQGAFRNVGTTSGTLMAGDNTYTKAQLDTAFGTKADKTNVLQLDNSTAFIPDADYEPSTKKYADEASGFKLLWLGNINSDASVILKLAGSLIITAARLSAGVYEITHNAGFATYFVMGIGFDTPSKRLASPRQVFDLTVTSFKITVSDSDDFDDANFQVSIYRYY
jgi:hypothetical protein